MSALVPDDTQDPPITSLLGNLGELIRQARQKVLRAVDTIQVQSCWQIGRHIVEFEQEGARRAGYGKQLLSTLAKVLTAEFGKGFDASNLRYMRLFYQAFPMCDALRHELSWTHYRRLLRVDNENARLWYMNESATQNWSSRALERQINTLYYERLLASRDRCPVIQEATTNIQQMKASPRDFIRDPVVLEFLGLPSAGRLQESEIEQALIEQLQDFLGEEDGPTVGIILCAQKDESVVRYSVLEGNEQLFASKYQLVLPSEEELRAELDRERAVLEERLHQEP
ncbi:PDDEXK nuclease domain-containing protein [Pseudomonas sp. MHK4]